MTALLNAASGRNPKFQLRAVMQVPIENEPQDILVDLVRNGQSFEVSLVHSSYAMTIRRSPEGTALALPRHKVVFIGKGESTTPDHLAMEGLLVRMISSMSEAGRFAPVMLSLEPSVVFKMAQSGMGAKIEESGTRFRISDMQIQVTQPGQVKATVSGMKMRAGVADLDKDLAGLEDWPGYQVEALNRDELERTLVRGLRRASEILLPGDSLKTPYAEERQVENGRLTWINGQRVAILRGTPEQIGRAHGELIGFEINMAIDSVMHVFGLAQTISTGKWFRTEMDEAFAQLEPHIPKRFRDENRALAKAVDHPPELLDALNVFPEMFHCSGFALTGSATTDGQLFHGRVLDYMTSIGLHDCATTFVVAPEGMIPFVNVGYAGFTGCVTGMNEAQISLGEMGGAGDGDWDGVPMATLMRMALEQCSSISEVVQLWENNPRTCEYFYLFADGKSKEAVGVAAVPEKVEVIRLGESDPRLGEGIPDTIVLSAGDRLETLRSRIAENHGRFDAPMAIELMARPVSMNSNLHNVLFVPAEGILYIAHANHRQPAAERNYVKFDFRELLTSP